MPECSYVDPYALDVTGVLPKLNNPGIANREYAQQEFSVHEMVEAYYNIYKSLL